jgi:transmembrane sensor
MSTHSDNEAVSAAAARWVVRRNAGLSAAEAEALRQWLAGDARHRAAFEHYARAWSAFDGPEREDAQGAMIRRIGARVKQRRARRAGGVLAAACAVAVAALVAVRPWPADADRSRPEGPPSAGTVVIQPERRVLEDGSVVELRADAVIDVRYDADTRRVVLSGGEAHFSVAKNPARPFVVETGGVEVRAVGTAFSVRLGMEQVEVLVTEGRVAVEKPAPARGGDGTGGTGDGGNVADAADGDDSPTLGGTMLGGTMLGDTTLGDTTLGRTTLGDTTIEDRREVCPAWPDGCPALPAPPAALPPLPPLPPPPPLAALATLGAREHLIVKTAPAGDADSAAPAPAIATLTSAEINERLAWRIPRVEFSATPLAEAIALINRSSHLPDGSASARLVLASELSGMAAEPVSGFFRADNIEAFVYLLGMNLGIEGERRGDEIILRKARR